ncbi:MAG: flagellar biosynthesis anti-sigma factor FlgM [Tissierellia bacterium]|nr:flagellar biosynthesis anti-sigma factor FlgM [Tissierellia bacterium]
MKINKTNNILGIFFNRNTNKVDKSRNSNKKDKLEVSDKAKDFQVALEKFKSLPDIRKEKVERLKKEVQSGTYKVEGRRIAEKILEGIDLDKRI